ncbi:hypothetical protein [Flavobacterium foetidum]|uniref:hypothetical protein n=1 Tax=Flavobacterium foetidum TaxID=2026681 RepID=UPI001074A2DB|nr:hypothetical protein [Flavobacterium foetidum]KAF2513404.1 hypothetical protein E0W73_14225 [Flavobacterium foetidum]
MGFNRLEIQRPDESGWYVLDEEYLLSYIYSDGWTERLLRFEIFVDIYYECRGEIGFFAGGYEKKEIESLFGLELPPEIKNLIKLLMDLEELRLKKTILIGLWKIRHRFTLLLIAMGFLIIRELRLCRKNSKIRTNQKSYFFS